MPYGFVFIFGKIYFYCIQEETRKTKTLRANFVCTQKVVQNYKMYNSYCLEAFVN